MSAMKAAVKHFLQLEVFFNKS